MTKEMDCAINACWTLRGKYGLYARPVRSGGHVGDPVLLVWAASTRDEADFDHPDHRIILHNKTWWVDHESGLHLMSIKQGPNKLALAIFNMMFPAS